MFKFSKSKNVLWLDDKDIKNHYLCFGTTGQGKSSSFSHYLYREASLANLYKDIIDVFYEAKSEFQKNEKMDALRLFIQRHKYDFICNKIDYHYYLTHEHTYIISQIKNLVDYIINQNDSSEDIIYFNAELIEQNLYSLENHAQRHAKPELSNSNPFALSIVNYFDLKKKEEEKLYLESIFKNASSKIDIDKSQSKKNKKI